MTLVTMINSVAEHAAGEEVELSEEEADRFILLGYADGVLSRDYTVDERNAFQAEQQAVSV